MRHLSRENLIPQYPAQLHSAITAKKGQNQNFQL